MIMNMFSEILILAKVPIILLILAPKSVIILGNAGQLLMTNCVCPETLSTTFHCTVSGSGTTVWQGSVFSCDNTDDGTLQLRHSQFANGSLVKECNSADGRMIMARAFEVTDNNYTSQLIIPVTPEIDNKTVGCAHDNGTTIRVISASTVAIISDPYPPPNNILLTGANMTQLNFSWSPVDSHCPNISYNINVTNNCGKCPRSTKDTSISCTTAREGYGTCFLTVQSEVCGNIVGYSSHPVAVIRKVPIIPEVNIFMLKNFTLLLTVVYEVVQFNISDGFDGSASSYMVLYNDSVSKVNCGLGVIPASSCDGLCAHIIEILSTPCFASTNITVTVFATNIFGNGPQRNVIVTKSQSESNTSECFVNHTSVNDDHQLVIGGLISSSTLLMAALLAVSAIFVTVVISLTKSKAKIQSELNTLRDSRENTTTYEDINVFPANTQTIKVNDNLAYANVVLPMQKPV